MFKTFKQNRFNTLIFMLILGTGIFWFGVSTHAATYYLSPTGNDVTGDGSEINPWFSPIKARKSTGAIQPGDTVIFKNGYYAYTDYINEVWVGSGNVCLLGYTDNDSGTAENPITYKAETRGDVTLDFECDYGWRLSNTHGADYIILDGFNIVNSSLGVRFESKGDIARYLNVTATPVWPANENACFNATGGGCFHTYKAEDFLIEHCIADNCAADGSSHGIYCTGKNGVIRDSIFRNNIGNGMQIQSNEAAKYISTIYIYRNKSYNNITGNGIYVSAYNGGIINAVYIYNNLIWNNGNYGITVGNEVSYAEVSNNTIYKNKYGINQAGLGGFLKNNITVDSANSDISWGTGQNGSIIKSYNLTTNGDEGVNYGVLTGAFPPSNFISIDPNNEQFLQLRSTAVYAIDQGVNLSSEGVTTDYFGTPRPQGSGYDIGAYEYTPICTDFDSDGYNSTTGICGTAADCDDNNALVNPGASEICNDGIDNDCDGDIDNFDSDCSGNPPSRSNPQPTGTLPSGTTSTIVSLVTDKTATCKYSETADMNYDSMTNIFSNTNSTIHSQIITGLTDGDSKTYYIRCQDEFGNVNANDFQIFFSIAAPTSPPVCTDFIYSDWSSCQSNNTQSRTIISSLPAGCSGGNPIIIQNCLFNQNSGGGSGETTPHSQTNGTTESEEANNSICYEYNSRNLFGINSNIVECISQREAKIIDEHNNYVKLDNVTLPIYQKVVGTKKEYANNMPPSNKYSIAMFIHTGTENTKWLGAGERAGVINSFYSAFNRFPGTELDWQDVIKIANGRWPKQINSSAEQNAKVQFKRIYLREANMNDQHDNAAVTIIAYGLRPANRNFNSEKNGINIFKGIFGHNPTSAIDWDMVRAINYSGASR